MALYSLAYLEFVLLIAITKTNALVFLGINPNPPVMCTPSAFVWTGAFEPLTLRLHAGNAAVEEFKDLSHSAFIWSTNVLAGTSVAWTLTDALGLSVSHSMVIGLGETPDMSCLSENRTTSPSSVDALSASPSMSPTSSFASSFYTSTITSSLILSSSESYLDKATSTEPYTTSSSSVHAPVSASTYLIISQSMTHTSSSHTPSSTIAEAVSESRHSPATSPGALAGYAVLGAAVVLCLAVSALCFCRARRRARVLRVTPLSDDGGVFLMLDTCQCSRH